MSEEKTSANEIKNKIYSILREKIEHEFKAALEAFYIDVEDSMGIKGGDVIDELISLNKSDLRKMLKLEKLLNNSNIIKELWQKVELGKSYKD